MKKKDALLIVLSLIAIPTMLAFGWIKYIDHIRDLQAAIPQEMWKYLDQNFFGSMYFYGWVAVSSFIGIVDALYFMPKKNAKALSNWRKRTLIGHEKTVLLILGLLIGSALLIPSQAVTDYTIHVLGVADEEFDAYYPIAWWSRYYGWEIYIYSAFDRFRDVYGLQFELVGWISYDSNDEIDCPVTRLDEAIRETGFEPFRTTFNGKIIDLLMVFNAQYFSGCNGLSIADWKAMLLCHSPEYPRIAYLCHEISHQFYLVSRNIDNHCENAGTCCMYNHWEFGLNFPVDWCEACRNDLNYNGHKNRFTYYNGHPMIGAGHHYRK